MSKLWIYNFHLTNQITVGIYNSISRIMVYTIANTSYDVFAIAFMVFFEQKNNYKLLYLFSIKPPHALPLLDMVLFWMWNVFFAYV